MDQTIRIQADAVALEGILSVPDEASGIVLFVHGSGSSRFSPRNAFVAEELQKAGIATLLLDLLSEEEDRVYENRFNIALLSERLGAVAAWLGNETRTKDLPLGFFGASTGAAAALVLAAKLGGSAAAVVSRGGRPDLAMAELGKVTAPTLLIVGGEDYSVIELNEQALRALRCEKRLEIIPGATHLFEEPGTLERVAALATDWFKRFFATPAGTAEEAEVAIPPKLRDYAEKPAQPPGKTRGAAKERYRPLRRK